MIFLAILVISIISAKNHKNLDKQNETKNKHK